MRTRIALGILLTASCTAGCATSGGVPYPFPTPRVKTRTATPSSPSAVATSGTGLTADGYAVAGTALDLRGSPYRDGGADPNGFDCSGLVAYVFGLHGIAVPRTVTDLYRTGQEVSPNDVRAGDLVFFSTTSPAPTHVGMAIGGDEFVHAPSSAGVVRVERLSGRYWAPRFIGARRVL